MGVRELKYLAFALTLSAVVLLAPAAKAIHTCGQMLGSCLVHIDPVVIPKPAPAPQPVKPAPQPAPRPTK